VIERAGTVIYLACVDFMLRVASLFGVTYRDANAGMFFVLWPAVTVTLAAIVLRQRVELRRLRARAAGAGGAGVGDGVRRESRGHVRGGGP
jgi:hypothetical protein